MENLNTFFGQTAGFSVLHIAMGITTISFKGNILKETGLGNEGSQGKFMPR
jgi:hypothetical protein